MNETRDSRIIVVFSGGRSCFKTINCGLFLPGDVVRLQSYVRYQEFENALLNVSNTMTAVIGPIIEQARMLMQDIMNNFREAYQEQYPSLQDMIEGLEDGLMKDLDYMKYYPKDPLPRPHKIIPAFNVHEAYKGRLNYKPVYYHCRNNC
jgi:hypothetical protein